MLFFFQRKGTAKVGAFFSPITCVWFAVLGGLGVFSIVQTPAATRPAKGSPLVSLRLIGSTNSLALDLLASRRIIFFRSRARRWHITPLGLLISRCSPISRTVGP
ncbi:MAG: KUP/HAK/KT family potassium transporter [Pirellulaceae bacterium]